MEMQRFDLAVLGSRNSSSRKRETVLSDLSKVSQHTAFRPNELCGSTLQSFFKSYRKSGMEMQRFDLAVLGSRNSSSPLNFVYVLLQVDFLTSY